MKKSLIVIIVALLAVSCQKATRLSADKSAICALKAGTFDRIHLHSDADNYSVEHCPEWMQASIMDSTLFCSVLENKTSALRKDSLVISCGGKELVIPVKQSFNITKLKPLQEKVEIDKAGGEQRVKLDTDGFDIKAIYPTTDIKVTLGDNEVIVYAKKNDGPSRCGDIILKLDTLEASIHYVVKGEFCGKCNGTGKVKCDRCHGTGFIIKYFSDFERRWETGCPKCGGDASGPVFTHTEEYLLRGKGKAKCPDCNGTGK